MVKKQFVKDIIDVAGTPEELSAKERYWIAFYDAANSDCFYNISEGGQDRSVWGRIPEDQLGESKNRGKAKRDEYLKSMQGHHPSATLTEEQAKEIVQRLLNGEFQGDIVKDYPEITISAIEGIRSHRTWKHLTEGVVFPDCKTMQRSKCAKAIKQYDLDGNFVARYESVQEAGRQLCITCPTPIYECVNKHRATAFGFYWAYEDDQSIYDKLNDKKYLEHHKKYYKRKDKRRVNIKSKQSKPVCKFSLNHELIEKYDSAGAAQRATEISHQNIIAVCIGKRKTAGGYIWKYADGIEEVS